MPWTREEAYKHKAGLSPRQASTWAAVANAILRECIEAGGSEETCAPKAIRIANSRVGHTTGGPKHG